MATQPVNVLDPAGDKSVVTLPSGNTVPVLVGDKPSVVSWLNAEQLARARQMMVKIDPNKPDELTALSIPIQKAVSTGIADILSEGRKSLGVSPNDNDPLNTMRNKDLDEGGQILAELLAEMEKLDPQELINIYDSWIIGFLPFGAGRWIVNNWGGARNYIRKYETVGAQIVELELRLKGTRMRLRTSVDFLRRQYDLKLNSLGPLMELIGAAEMRLAGDGGQEGLRAEILRRSRAMRDGEVQEAEQIRRLTQFQTRLERRIEGWHGALLNALQTARWFSALEEADQAFIDQIEDAILQGIPAWRDQGYIIIERINMKKAREIIQAFRARLNELIQTNARLIGEELGLAADEAAKATITLQTYQVVQTSLDQTTARILTARRNERQRRAIEMPQLIAMQQANVRALASIAEAEERETEEAQLQAQRPVVSDL